MHRHYADIRQAEGLLLDNCLVWSDDFESIRPQLAELMRSAAGVGEYAHPAIVKLAQAIISTENDLTI
jgi:prophage DNA circulation protein